MGEQDDAGQSPAPEVAARIEEIISLVQDYGEAISESGEYLPILTEIRAKLRALAGNGL